MWIRSTIILLVGLIAKSAFTAPALLYAAANAIDGVKIDLTSDAAGSGIVTPMNIHGYITPGGPVFNFTGTLEQVIPQIKELYPDWDPTVPTPTTENPSKVKRYFQNRPTCWLVVGWNTGRAGAFGQADYLEALGEHTMCGAEARTCARTGCNNESAVDLCNDIYNLKSSIDWTNP
ncbi:hypothetical protein AOL_s00004g146 [Orbilia oligospora ATCC 24927]|uniref:Uncharacterized protein n=1 Tax=Arthrobotrys oligospora (strain ATCC 24927 / CBS 115.81 / DSM 1491) TaxID=756982 RepID=G1WXY6_ARTOA|nr:hypothetical protein AOL_s00004g146 [Orbilia oligospora ATCC 24927]EGX54113.1 hypothetical protein AOL_s00004g146 [Orbilia oligospora ATCC 24927]